MSREGLGRVVALVALLGTFALRGTAAPPAPMVAASQHPQGAIAIAFIRPHAPRVLAFEQRSLRADVEGERVRRGLPALAEDATLNRFAMAKAVEMASRGYFGHTSPDGVTFQDRLRRWNWPTPYAAENIAFDRDEAHAHAAFMTSAAHAANVLDPREQRLGIAVVNVGNDETFYVEVLSE